MRSKNARTCRDFVDRIDASPEKFRGLLFAGQLVDRSLTVETAGDRAPSVSAFFSDLAISTLRLRRFVSSYELGARNISGSRVIPIACIPADKYHSCLKKFRNVWPRRDAMPFHKTKSWKAERERARERKGHVVCPSRTGSAKSRLKRVKSVEDFGRNTFDHRLVAVGGCEETDFQASRSRSIRSLSLSLSVRRLSCLFLDPRHAGSFHLSVYLSVSVSWLSRSLSRLGVAPLLRFTFAMSLPVRSGRGKSVTQAREVRGHRRGLDLVCVKQEKQGLPSSLDLTREERSLLCRFYAVEA